MLWSLGVRERWRQPARRVIEGRRIEVRGTVQGVGFRPWVYRLAVEEGLSGRVRNDAARGHDRGLRAPRGPRGLPAASRDGGPAGRARSARCARSAIPAEPLAGFAIVPSEGGGARAASRSRPTSPRARSACARSAIPRTGATSTPSRTAPTAGPRFTIARDVPYDRPATTMAGFAMCPDCRREYEDPLDRRFHAQPIACPACGPRAAAPGRRPADRRSPTPATRSRTAARALARRADRGGEGPRRLPPRVRRDVARGRAAPPRAQEARREAVRGHGPRPRRRARARASSIPPRSACSPRSSGPIVLVRQRPGSGLAPEVAPGNPLVGPDPGLHAAAPPPARGRGAAARHDLGQPLGGADGGEGRARRSSGSPASPTSSSPTTARSRTAATTRWPA